MASSSLLAAYLEYSVGFCLQGCGNFWQTKIATVHCQDWGYEDIHERLDPRLHEGNTR